MNGVVITQPATEVDPARDIIEVQGKTIKPEKKIYIMLNKPSGYISSVTDKHGRKTVIDLLQGIKERVFPVGRLDYDSEGLILLTNDGEFAQRLTHPSYEVPRVYEVKVAGQLKRKEIEKLKKGQVIVDGKPIAPCRVWILGREEGATRVKIEMHEGRKRQIKKMMASLGHPVLSLKRTMIGNLTLGKLRPGEFRYLDNEEVHALLAGLRPKEKKGGKGL